MKKKQSKFKNIKPKNNKIKWKYLTFILAGLIVIVLGYLIIDNMLDSKYEEGIIYGQHNAVNIILTEISQKGEVIIPLNDNESLILLPSQAIPIAQLDILQQITQAIDKQGFVQFTLDNQSYTLVIKE